MLEIADVNALVRQYSHLEAHLQAHEEWWGGAISLDNFLGGVWLWVWVCVWVWV